MHDIDEYRCVYIACVYEFSKMAYQIPRNNYYVVKDI
jgi:hypothetical protein